MPDQNFPYCGYDAARVPLEQLGVHGGLDIIEAASTRRVESYCADSSGAHHAPLVVEMNQQRTAIAFFKRRRTKVFSCASAHVTSLASLPCRPPDTTSVYGKDNRGLPIISLVAVYMVSATLAQAQRGCS